jgi:ADP-ribose pyrophosphatase
VLESRTIFRGKVVQLKVERVAEPGGVVATREVVCHSGSVVILPHLSGGRIIMVRQYRHAVGETLWELVAGSIEQGETPRKSARRELLEETGYRARVMKPLLEFFPSPGVMNEKMHLFEAWDLTLSKSQPDVDEHLEVGIFSTGELIKMVQENQIRDAKTLVGILWLFGAHKRTI